MFTLCISILCRNICCFGKFQQEIYIETVEVRDVGVLSRLRSAQVTC